MFNRIQIETRIVWAGCVLAILLNAMTDVAYSGRMGQMTLGDALLAIAGLTVGLWLTCRKGGN